jgi:hypothetical protein
MKVLFTSLPVIGQRVMGSRVALLYLLAVLAIPLAAHATNSKADLLTIQTEAWRVLLGPRVDIAAFRRIVTPDFIYVEGNGKTYSVEENAAALATCSFQSFKIRDPQIRWLSADAGLIVYHLSLDGSCHGQQIPTDFEVSAVWVKRNGGWLAELYAETVATALP